MNFLNPSILFGLFAISIPILIHLLNLRKIRKVEFSTLMFLKEIQKSKMRRIRLKQILLLLLRIFTIIFLVLTFANPVYEGFAGNNDNAGNTTALIFIDDSFSMEARDNKGLYLSQAKEAVKKILESHKESDNVYFIPVSKIDFKNNKILFDSFKEILDSLDKLKFSYKPAGMNEILNFADQILANSKNPDKEIYVISDFQKSNLNGGITSAGSISNLNDKSVNTYLIKIGEREVNNLSSTALMLYLRSLKKIKTLRSEYSLPIIHNSMSRIRQ
ncbi:MAG: BatA and WFA domain-containing protein [Ignavibacteria bacterium]|nr:BatA and WFA domain-containing protein [Ignavibacteria bacterium]